LKTLLTQQERQMKPTTIKEIVKGLEKTIKENKKTLIG
tara:strand:- start:399 stop:512 length:114 start_codon:yes stop_codon:yes gene_type:complete